MRRRAARRAGKGHTANVAPRHGIFHRSPETEQNLKQLTDRKVALNAEIMTQRRFIGQLQIARRLWRSHRQLVELDALPTDLLVALGSLQCELTELDTALDEFDSDHPD
jgi:hypothetical protein